MSDCSDIYCELHKDEFEKELMAGDYRRRLEDELSSDDMIKIIFHDYIKRKPDYEVIELAKRCFK